MGLRLRFCTGAQDETLRVCAGMKADPGDERTVSQVPKPQTLNRTRVPQSTTLNPYPSPLASSSKLQAPSSQGLRATRARRQRVDSFHSSFRARVLVSLGCAHSPRSFVPVSFPRDPKPGLPCWRLSDASAALLTLTHLRLLCVRCAYNRSFTSPVTLPCLADLNPKP